MFLIKLKSATAVLLMIAGAGIGGGRAALLAGNEFTTGEAVAPKEESPNKKAKPDKADINLKEGNDAEGDKFIRRAYLDLLGAFPTPDGIRQIQQDKAHGKRNRLAARLHVRVTMEDALNKLPDDETRRLALDDIEKFVKVLKEKDKTEDRKFIQRTYLDLLGVLPTPDEIKRFQEDKAPGKRKRLVARLTLGLLQTLPVEKPDQSRNSNPRRFDNQTSRAVSRTVLAMEEVRACRSWKDLGCSVSEEEQGLTIKQVVQLTKKSIADAAKELQDAKGARSTEAALDRLERSIQSMRFIVLFLGSKEYGKTFEKPAEK